MKKMYDINSLLSVKSYAKMKDISTTYVYKLAKLGKIEMVEIDNVKFINVNNANKK